MKHYGVEHHLLKTGRQQIRRSYRTLNRIEWKSFFALCGSVWNAIDRRRCVQDPEWQDPELQDPEWQDPEVYILQFGKIKKNATKNTSNQLNENRGEQYGSTCVSHAAASSSAAFEERLLLLLSRSSTRCRTGSRPYCFQVASATAHRVACPGEMQRDAAKLGIVTKLMIIRDGLTRAGFLFSVKFTLFAERISKKRAVFF